MLLVFARRLILFCLVLAFNWVYAQYPTFYHSNVSLLSPSPEASSFGKYGDVPIDLYTGRLTYPIPIHSIDLDGKKIDFSISYSMNGLRPMQESSSVGLGWSLNAGAVINRTINDQDDLLLVNWNGTPYSKNGWIFQEPFREVDHEANIYGISSEYIVPNQTDYEIRSGSIKPDLEPDLFTVDLFGERLEFVLNKDAYKPPQQENDTATIVNGKCLNRKGYIVRYKIYENNFLIFDPYGYKYYFDVTGKQYVDGDYASPSTVANTISWFISKIVSPLNNEVRFSYNKEVAVKSATTFITQNYSRYFSSGIYSGLCVDPGSGGGGPVDAAFNFDQLFPPLIKSWYKQEEVYVTSIQFQNEELSFIYSFDRLDLEPLTENPLYEWHSATFIPGKKAARLNQIDFHFKLKPYGSSLRKSIKFKNSYFNQGKANQIDASKWVRLKLDAVEIQDKVYQFEYESQNSLPSKESYSLDVWGFYNGKTQTVLHPPYQLTSLNTNELISLPGVKREANNEFAKIGVLKSVIYPTNGKTEFIYEGNEVALPKAFKYTWEENKNNLPVTGSLRNKEVGGLRIKELKNFDRNEKLIKSTTYKYSDENGLSTGILFDTTYSSVVKHEFSAGKRKRLTTGPEADSTCDGFQTVFYFVVSSEPNSKLGSILRNGHVGYSMTTTFAVDANNISNSLKSETIFHNAYSIDKWYSEGPLNNPDYCKAAQPGDANYSKHVIEALNWGLPAINYTYENGKILKEIHYNNNVKLKELNYTYEKIKDGFVIGVKAQTGIQCVMNIPDLPIGKAVDIFQNYKHEIYDFKLVKIKEDEFNGDNTLSKIRTFKYNREYWLLDEEASINSESDSLKRKIEYAFNFPNKFSEALSKRVLFSQVREAILKNNNLIDISATEIDSFGRYFKYYNANLSSPLPSSYLLSSFDLPEFELKAQLNFYPNSARIKEYSTSSGNNGTYLWGYYSRVPILEVKDLSYDQLILLTSLNQNLLDIGEDTEGRSQELSRVYNLLLQNNKQASIQLYNPLIGISFKSSFNMPSSTFYYNQDNKLDTVFDRMGNVKVKYFYID